jgi:molecular chaperone DnaK
MNEFKDQLDTAEKEKVSKLISELRELAVKGQAADPAVTAEIIKEKIDATQQASLGLFQKVRLLAILLFFEKIELRFDSFAGI